jgi:hypothetical protein
MDRNRALDRLRNVQPSKVVAVVGDDTRTIAIGRAGARGRWERAADAIAALDASEVQLLDGDGAILEVLGEVAEDAPLAPIPAGAGTDERALLAAERIAHLVTRASEAARESVLRETRASQEAYVELLRLVVGRVSQLEGVYSKVLQAQYAATIAQAEAATPQPESETEKMMTSMLPILAAKLGAGAS